MIAIDDHTGRINNAEPSIAPGMIFQLDHRRQTGCGQFFMYLVGIVDK